MNGIDTREQRKAHVKALVDETKDLERSLALAEQRLDETSEDKLVQRARAQHRVNHLQERLAATKEQLADFTGGARAPRQGAETRSQPTPPVAPTPEPTPAAEPPAPEPKPAAKRAPQGGGGR